VTRRRWPSYLGAAVLVAAIAAPAIALAGHDRELVPVWELHDDASARQVRSLAEALGIPGTVRRDDAGWRVAEGGVELTVRREFGLPWRAGPAGGEATRPDASRADAVRVAREVVAAAGGPRVEVVGGRAGEVVLRPRYTWGAVSAMPWRIAVDRTGRVVAASGWLDLPTPRLATPTQLRGDDRLLPRGADVKGIVFEL
jgi:hypothetical protein